MKITVASPVIETPRVLQVRGLFDLPAEATSRLEWDVDLPLGERAWNIGLITGPSGCGKSTVARALFGDTVFDPERALVGVERSSVLDLFPAELPVKEVAELLSSVGFSSPPAWLRPYDVLSTGQKFRVQLALALTRRDRLVVLDEYTSVVDRTVAQVGSAAVARTVRRRGQQFVAVTCHDDVIDWLQPDWVYQPAEGRFAWRCLQRRPAIDLFICRCKAEAWPLFRPHHYLSHDLNPSAVCFLAAWRDRPVAFSSWLPFVGRGIATRREHRTVTLPDYQGVGIGFALSSFCASLWKALGYRATSTTTHPAFIAARRRSELWRLTRAPSLADGRSRGFERTLRHAATRLTAGFEYVGPPLDYVTAARLMSSRLSAL
jgi:Fe-S cluster assembly ATPase SufC/GNAT superfamily N-acetyltransferase